MLEENLSENVKGLLIKMDFDDLKRLIENCLYNVGKRNQIKFDFFTDNPDVLSIYADILQAKINKPISLNSNFNFGGLEKTIMFKTRERLRNELLIKYEALKSDTYKIEKNRFEKKRLEGQIEGLEKIIKEYDKKIASAEKTKNHPKAQKKRNKYTQALLDTYNTH